MQRNIKRFIHERTILVLLVSMLQSPFVLAQEIPRKINFQRILDGRDIVLGEVEAIYQDSDGFMWFGGRNALLRFDGYNFKKYEFAANADDLEKAKRIKSVTDIFEDTQQNIWISTWEGLVKLDRMTDKVVALEQDESQEYNLSTLFVDAITESPDGKILAGTIFGLAIYDPSTGTQEFLRPNLDFLKNTDRLRIQRILADGDIFWLTCDYGVLRFDWKTKAFELFALHDETVESAKKYVTTGIAKANETGKLWLGTENGLYLYDTNTRTSKHYTHNPQNPGSLGANAVWNIFLDSQKNLWVATDHGGLNLYVPETDSFIRYLSNAHDRNTLNSNQVRSIFEDSVGDFWVGNYPEGINYFDRSSTAITSYNANGEEGRKLSNNSVLAVQEDRFGDLWFGTDGGGLNKLNRKSGKITHYKHNKDNSNSITSDAVLTAFIDSTDTLWLGTWGGGVTAFDIQNQQFEPLPFDAAPATETERTTYESKKLNSANVWAIIEDHKNDLWIGTHNGGLSHYQRKNKIFKHYTHSPSDENSIAHNLVWSVLEDSENSIWVGTADTLDRLDRNTGTFKHYVPDENNPRSLSDNSVLTLYEDSQKRLWIGTSKGLNLFNKDSDDFTVFGKDNGFNDETIRNIQEDKDGVLWLSTDNGVSSFDTKNQKVKNYSRESGALMGSFNTGAGFATRRGEMVFGGTNGVRIFNTEGLKDNTHIPPIVFTDFKIFADSVIVGAQDGVLEQSINNTKSITLDYTKTMFVFEFAALSFRDSEKNLYAYKLEGFDDEWLEVGSQRRAKYTNLDAGKYVFRVRASNNDHYWNKQGREIALTQLPPPWRTWWAYSIYVLLVLLAVFSFIRHQRNKVKEAEERAEIERQNAEMQRSVNIRLKHLDKMKDDFLANTSHELRTPLNGIIGLADSLIDGAAGELEDTVKYNLRMISASGQRLAGLVNEILDFSKLKNNKIRLTLKPTDIKSTAEVVLKFCEPLVGGKSISLSCDIPEDLPAAMADENRLQQIFYNLIGNAIKFTEEGQVNISAELDGARLWVHIRDTGVGIPLDKQSEIFASFEQIEGHEDRQHGGTGLGLSVTKQLVELHDGSMKVESSQGQGSTFSFCLVITDEAASYCVMQHGPESALANKVYNDKEFNDDEHISADEHTLADEASVTVADQRADVEITKINEEFDRGDSRENSTFRILIVDDERINRQVLLNQLQSMKYQTTEASSGYEALQLLRDGEIFDLILLDVMMPRMSGYEVCRQIRETVPMHELPIIFLTAKNLISDLVDGFEVGANDFLTKPIAKSELKSRVRTHLELLDIHKNLENKVLERTEKEQAVTRELKSLDQIVATINKEVRHDRLLEVLLKEASILLPNTTSAAYWQLDLKSQTVRCCAAIGFDASIEKPIHLNANHFSSKSRDRVKKLGEHIFLTYPSGSMAGLYNVGVRPLPKSQLVLEMLVDGHFDGFMVLEDLDHADAFKEYVFSTISRFRVHSLSALSKAKLLESMKEQNELLEQVSLTDQLTGLRNRHYIFKYMDKDISLSNRKHNAFNHKITEFAPDDADHIFFMLDLDQFKDVNDTFGHQAGDKVLIQIKDIIEELFRASDHLVRWGGEEFLVVARLCNRDSAVEIAERVRQAFEKFEFRVGDDRIIKKTVSIGFTCYPFHPKQPELFSWEQVLDLADHCLYSAKTSQRNAWVGMFSVDDQNPDDIPTFSEIIESTIDLSKQRRIKVVTSVKEKSKLVWHSIK